MDSQSAVPFISELPDKRGGRIPGLTKELWEESKKLWEVAGRAAVTRLAFYGMGVVSQAFAGHLGERELAAVAIAITVISGLNLGFFVRTHFFSSLISCIFFLEKLHKKLDAILTTVPSSPLPCLEMPVNRFGHSHARCTKIGTLANRKSWLPLSSLVFEALSLLGKRLGSPAAPVLQMSCHVEALTFGGQSI